MAGRYGVCPRARWRDPAFRALSDDAKLVEFYLRSTPVGHIAGAVIGGIAAHADEIGWPTRRFETAARELEVAGVVKIAPTERLIWVPAILEEDPPNNPNALRAWAKLWPEVPACPLKEAIWEALQPFRDRYERLPGEEFDRMFPQPHGE